MSPQFMLALNLSAVVVNIFGIRATIDMTGQAPRLVTAFFWIANLGLLLLNVTLAIYNAGRI